jgi:hypothetical protein
MELPKKSSVRWIVLLSALFLLLPAPAQEPPKDLRDWQLICYCSGGDPDEIVRKDNNGQILFTARRGTTRERLKSDGIAFTESQIELLKDWRLLAEQEEQLKTRMPVVGPEEMTRLRALLHVQAVELGRSLQPDFKALVAAVTQRGYADNSYSIAFSYLLDGMVWDEFDERHLLPSMETTADQPLWAGALWAIYPQRSAPGTNSKSHGGWSLSVMWTQSVQPLLTPLNSSSLVHTLLDDLATRGRASDPATRNQLVALGILSEDGTAAVPVIHEVPSDRIYAESLAISHKVGDGMLRAMQSPALLALTGSDDSSVALVIAYHEFMWELLAYLEQSGIVSPPAILSAKTFADPRRVHDLVFIVVPQAK